MLDNKASDEKFDDSHVNKRIESLTTSLAFNNTTEVKKQGSPCNVHWNPFSIDNNDDCENEAKSLKTI